MSFEIRTNAASLKIFTVEAALLSEIDLSCAVCELCGHAIEAWPYDVMLQRMKADGGLDGENS